MIRTNEAIYLWLNTKIVRKENNYNEAFTSSNINLVLNEAMKHDFSSLSLCLHQLQKCFLIPRLRSIHNISSLKMNLNRLKMHPCIQMKGARGKCKLHILSCQSDIYHVMRWMQHRVVFLFIHLRVIYTSPIGTQARAAVLLSPIKGTQDQAWTVAK